MSAITTDAVHVASKPSTQTSTHARFEKSLPTLLSVIAGMVDLTGLVNFHLFTAHITGNLVMVSALLVRGSHVSKAQFLAIPVFVVAVAATWLIAKASGWHGPRLLRLLLVAQFLLIACVLIVSVITKPSTNPNALMGTIAAMIAVSAMACQFALLRLTMPVAPTTAVMTGNLTTTFLFLFDTTVHSEVLMMRDTEKLRGTAHLLIGFLVGCLLSAGAIAFLGHEWAWAVPVVASAMAMILS